jgi:hypothetical protein
MSKKVALALAFLTMLAVFTPASSAIPSAPFPQEYKREWIGGISAALSLVFALCFIFLGIAKAFNLRSLELATKGEMFQVFASLAIAGFIFAGGLEWVLSLLGGERLYEDAKVFIDETWNRALKLYVETLAIRGLAHLLASVEVGGEAGIVVVGVSLGAHPFAFLKPIAASLNRLGWFFILILFSLKVHSTLLWFGHAIALKALLGPGVLLRAFKLTRVAGAFLIGLAIALYLVFPAVVVGVYKASYDEGKARLAEERTKEVRGELEGYKEDLLSFSWDAGSLLAKLAVVPYALYKAFKALFDALMLYLEELILLFMVLPLVTAGVLVATVFAITESLGGRSYVLRRFISLGRMV